jgi:hypothetical protein
MKYSYSPAKVTTYYYMNLTATAMWYDIGPIGEAYRREQRDKLVKCGGYVITDFFGQEIESNEGPSL